MRRLVELVSVLLLALALSSCARATPICDTASGLLEGGRLGAATELYARAAQAGEGGCADNGLSSAGERYAAAYRAVAAGSDAEIARDAATARNHYEEAQQLDVGNPAAVTGLARLGAGATRIETPVVVAPATTTIGAGVQPGWLAGLVAGTLVLALGAAFTGWRQVRRLDTRIDLTNGHRDRQAQEAISRLDEVDRRLAETEKGQRHLGADAVEIGQRLDRLGEQVIKLDDAHREVAQQATLDHESLKTIEEYLDGFSTDQLRLLALVSDRLSGTEEGEASTGTATLTHFSALGVDVDVIAPDGELPAEQLVVNLVVCCPRADDEEDRPQFVVYEFRVEAERIDLLEILTDAYGPVADALRGLGSAPDYPDLLAEALEAHAVDACGWRSMPMVEADALPPPMAETAFWRSWDGTAVLSWTYRTSTTRGRTEVLTLASPTATARLVDAPRLATVLGEASGPTGAIARALAADLLRTALEQALVCALTAQREARIDPAGPGSLVQVDASGAVDTVNLAGAVPPRP